jgi:polyisoprenoid-binding protein YceI
MKRSLFAIPALLAASALAGTAFAQAAPDTVAEVVANGTTIEVEGQAFNIDYTPDGKFTGGDGMFSGTWKKADDGKLCISLPDMGVENQCTAYPEGKKAGDTFDIVGEQGTMKVTIRQPAQ